MRDDTSWAGLDVHQEQIVVAVIGVEPEGKAKEFQVRHDAGGIKRLIRKLREIGTRRLECAYEAGPCGFELQRRLQAEGIRCAVIAPSLTPVKPGERIKTDRRDARKLAEHLRAGLLTEIAAPSRCEEAARDLSRCRDDARQDLMRARQSCRWPTAPSSAFIVASCGSCWLTTGRRRSPPSPLPVSSSGSCGRRCSTPRRLPSLISINNPRQSMHHRDSRRWTGRTTT